jgi:hypothetical protein
LIRNKHAWARLDWDYALDPENPNFPAGDPYDPDDWTQVGHYTLRYYYYNYGDGREQKKEVDDGGLLAWLIHEGEIKVVKNTSTCAEDGELTLAYKCHVCGQYVDEDTIKMLKHDEEPEDIARLISETPATCTSEGLAHYETHCKVCDRLLKEEDIKLEKLHHTNDPGYYDPLTLKWHWTWRVNDAKAAIRLTGDPVIIDSDGLLKYSYEHNHGVRHSLFNQFTVGETGYAVTAKAYTVCDTCGGNELAVGWYAENDLSTHTDADLDGLDNEWNHANHDVANVFEDADIFITVTDLTMPSADGAAGSITVKATYKKAADGTTISTETQTFPYYSSVASYLSGNTGSKPEAKNGLVLDGDGVWRYYVGGVFKSDYNGIVRYNGGSFFVANGLLCKDANGLNLNSADKKWYFLSQGQVQTSYTGLAEYDGEWFSIQGGVLDESVEGLVPYNGGSFLFSAGRLRKDVSGLWGADVNGDFWYLAKGQAQTQYTGLAEYQGSWFYVMGGKWANKYNGTVVYDGVKFKVVNGQVYQAA